MGKSHWRSWFFKMKMTLCPTLSSRLIQRCNHHFVAKARSSQGVKLPCHAGCRSWMLTGTPFSLSKAPLDLNKYKRQVASGSGSTPNGWESFKAGAAVKHAQNKRPSQKWNVPMDESPLKTVLLFMRKQTNDWAMACSPKRLVTSRYQQKFCWKTQRL